jgi:nicotinamide mononucleotide transporter
MTVINRFGLPLIIMLESLLQELIEGLKKAPFYEIVAALAGIGSVWFSKKESVWVYPVGLINTLIYVWISLNGHLAGEATVNFYYTVMSIYGWYVWTRRDTQQQVRLHVTCSNRKEWAIQVSFFLICLTILFISINYLKDLFFEGAIPWADSLAAATAFTGMWLMTRKKVESWYWWIATNLCSIPLYISKGWVVTSLYYFILLFLAIAGLADWKKRANA